MKNFNIKAVLPFISGIIIFTALTFTYFSPLLKGKVMVQSDMVSNAGMAKETVDFREKYNQESLWTNSMFGGMPTYQISIKYPGAIIYQVRDAFMLWMKSPANMLFNYMLGFFILLLVLRVNPWLSIVGAIAFAFSAYNFIIIDAGHLTKALAIGFMAPVFAGVVLVMRQKYLLGGVITAFFLAMELVSNHLQITYYLMLFLLIYSAIEYVALIKSKQFLAIGKTIGVFTIAIIIAVACNAGNLLNTIDYAKYTIRGESELTDDAHNKTSGLDKDYAVQWSLGKAETMTLMIPGFKGRSSSIRVAENKNALKKADANMRENIGGMQQYWGDQPFTISPYSGAIVIFLFVLGLFIVQGRMKWALLIATIFSILLSWGSNFMGLTELFLDYLPGYNKFRAVSMILVIAEFAIPILAILAINKLITEPGFLKSKIKLIISGKEISGQTVLIISFALTGGLSLLFFLMPSLTNFFNSTEYDTIYDQIAKSNGEQLALQFLDNVEKVRIALFKADAIRSFGFISAAAILVWLYTKNNFNKAILIGSIGVLVLLDLWFIDKNYLKDDTFVNKKEAQNPFQQSLADIEILKDKDNYRVLNIAVNTFNDASTSYYHKSIGGYHAAKLRRYQDLIDKHINTNIENIKNALSTNPSDSSIRYTFSQQRVLNMLNMRYLIYNPQAAPLQNRYAQGNAWFVKDFKVAADADEEIKTLGSINTLTSVVVDKKFLPEMNGFTYKEDNAASIRLTDYKPNHLTYESKTNSEQLAVFSEIYYEDGWNAYIDGQLKPHFRVNYVLRSMKIPAGNHKIEFKFEPAGYYTRDRISLIAGCILILGIVLAVYFLLFKNRKQ